MRQEAIRRKDQTTREINASYKKMDDHMKDTLLMYISKKDLERELLLLEDRFDKIHHKLRTDYRTDKEIEAKFAKLHKLL